MKAVDSHLMKSHATHYQASTFFLPSKMWIPWTQLQHLDHIDFRSLLSRELKLCENLNHNNSAFADMKNLACKKKIYVFHGLINDLQITNNFTTHPNFTGPSTQHSDTFNNSVLSSLLFSDFYSDKNHCFIHILILFLWQYVCKVGRKIKHILFI